MSDSFITNTNFLPLINFKFGIKKLPTTSFFIQSVNIPGIKLGFAEVPTPFIKYPIPGDHVQFSDFTMTFRVDEDMKNYLEIYNWIVQLGFPDSFDQYKLIDGKSATTGEGKLSDGTLEVLNSAKTPKILVTIVDMFPRSLSDIVFDTRDTQNSYAEATAVFKLRKVQIKYL